jgi:hypothetical protein
MKAKAVRAATIEMKANRATETFNSHNTLNNLNDFYGVMKPNATRIP